ncbi:unnamed protein product [Durusdinium trenchii]|uniref:C3H1-type domain-containing protein n=2 Tax=Durusdinium trenchii TaxID=1381693 RepID=A0ABP0HBY5_9DINO
MQHSTCGQTLSFAMDTPAPGGIPASDGAPELCRNFVYRGRCGYASCCFLHDESARQQARGTPMQLPSKSLRSSGVSDETENAEAREVFTAPQRRPASIRYLFEGQSVHSNPYLKEFAGAPWLARLLEAPECARLFNVQGKRLRKELTEAFGLLHACNRALKKLAAGQTVASQGGKGVTIVDLCCGKGFGSLVLACSFPSAEVLAVDRNAHMDLSHFKACPNLRFQHLNMESSSLAADLAAWLSTLMHL